MRVSWHSCSRSHRGATCTARPAHSARGALVLRSAHARHASQQLEEQPQPHTQQHVAAADAAVTPMQQLSSTDAGARHQSPLMLLGTSHAGAQITLGLTVALLALSLASEPAAAADGMQQHQHSIQPIMDLAEGEEFWGNVAKYGRYFVTVMLGTGYVMVQPLIAAFKRPVTAVAAIVGLGGTFVLLKFVLNAMLGVEEPFMYEPGSIVPYDF